MLTRRHFAMTGTCDRFADGDRPLYMVYCYACKTAAAVEADDLDDIKSMADAAKYLTMGNSRLSKMIDEVGFGEALTTEALDRVRDTQ